MRRNQLFWGVVLMLFGIVLLLGNVFQINIWDYLWPLVFIALGAWILWSTFQRPELATETLVIPLEGGERARIKVRYGAGKLTLHGDPDATDLLVGNFSGGVEHMVRQEGELTEVTLRSPARQMFLGPWNWWEGAQRKWSIGLSARVPLELDLETGACDAHLNLAALPVTRLRLQTGASSTSLRLPEHAGHTQVRIEAGAASVEVRVPEGVAARINARGGLASITVDTARFPRDGGVYQSPDYEWATHRVEIDVETGVGSVDIR